MPLSASGEKVLGHFKQEYGAKAGTSNFYASINAGTLPANLHRADALTPTGKKIVPSVPASQNQPRADARKDEACPQHGYMDAARRGDAAGMASASDRMLRGRVVR